MMQRVGFYPRAAAVLLAYHDRATGTTVFRKQDLYATRGFTPVMAVEESDPPALNPAQTARMADRMA